MSWACACAIKRLLGDAGRKTNIPNYERRNVEKRLEIKYEFRVSEPILVEREETKEGNMMKLTVAPMVNKFPAFDVTRSLIQLNCRILGLKQHVPPKCR